MKKRYLIGLLLAFLLNKDCYGAESLLSISKEPLLSPSLTLRTTTDPDEIYDFILKSNKCKNIALILDIDGTLTNEDNPELLQKNQTVTPRGQAVENVKKLLLQGATIIFCSAWHTLEETKHRLNSIGFSDDDLGISQEILFKSGKKNITLDNQVVSVTYQQQGRLISTRLASLLDKYYRNKAFSFYMNPHKNIQEIYFLDDSSSNVQRFYSDCKKYNLFSSQSVFLYQVSYF